MGMILYLTLFLFYLVSYFVYINERKTCEIGNFIDFWLLYFWATLEAACMYQSCGSAAIAYYALQLLMYSYVLLATCGNPHEPIQAVEHRGIIAFIIGIIFCILMISILNFTDGSFFFAIF